MKVIWATHTITRQQFGHSNRRTEGGPGTRCAGTKNTHLQPVRNASDAHKHTQARAHTSCVTCVAVQSGCTDLKSRRRPQPIRGTVCAGPVCGAQHTSATYAVRQVQALSCVSFCPHQQHDQAAATPCVKKRAFLTTVLAGHAVCNTCSHSNTPVHALDKCVCMCAPAHQS